MMMPPRWSLGRAPVLGCTVASLGVTATRSPLRYALNSPPLWTKLMWTHSPGVYSIPRISIGDAGLPS